MRFLSDKWASQTVIHDIGKLNFIVIFDSIEEMELALYQKDGVLNDTYVDIRKWSETECCRTRCVWLKVLGIPPHAWCRSNMEDFCPDLFYVFY